MYTKQPELFNTNAADKKNLKKIVVHKFTQWHLNAVLQVMVFLRFIFLIYLSVST